MLKIHGYRIKLSWYDRFLCEIFWDREIPRNVYDFTTLYAMVILSAFALPILWVLMHVPIIWPEMLGGFVGVLCGFMLFKPYADYLRALFMLIAACFMLFHNVKFGAEIWGFHIERYLYYIAIAASLFALWRRFWNWLAWSQIDRICNKYEIPRYDQKELMDAYEGYDTHYGEEKPKAYRSYTEAVNAEENNENNEYLEEN